MFGEAKWQDGASVGGGLRNAFYIPSATKVTRLGQMPYSGSKELAD